MILLPFRGWEKYFLRFISTGEMESSDVSSSVKFFDHIYKLWTLQNVHFNTDRFVPVQRVSSSQWNSLISILYTVTVYILRQLFLFLPLTLSFCACFPFSSTRTQSSHNSGLVLLWISITLSGEIICGMICKMWTNNQSKGQSEVTNLPGNKGYSSRYYWTFNEQKNITSQTIWSCSGLYEKTLDSVGLSAAFWGTV